MILPIERMETNKHIFSISIHTTNRVGKERCFVYQLEEHTLDVYVDNILFISTEEACQRFLTSLQSMCQNFGFTCGESSIFSRGGRSVVHRGVEILDSLVRLKRQWIEKIRGHIGSILGTGRMTVKQGEMCARLLTVR